MNLGVGVGYELGLDRVNSMPTSCHETGQDSVIRGLSHCSLAEARCHSSLFLKLLLVSLSPPLLGAHFVVSQHCLQRTLIVAGWLFSF